MNDIIIYVFCAAVIITILKFLEKVYHGGTDHEDRESKEKLLQLRDRGVLPEDVALD